MKIYEHPLNSNVTVVEIERNDENEAFLNDVITGFELFGNTYPSASLGAETNKKVIYLDGRKKNIFENDADILCALTAELANIQNEKQKDVTVDDCISLAEAAGNQSLINTLLSKAPEYFNSFNTERKSA